MKQTILSTLLLAIAWPVAAQNTPVVPVNPVTPITPGTASSTSPTALPAGIPEPRKTVADARLSEEAQAPLLTFQEAIALALQNNPTRAQARAAVAAAQARVGQARSQGGPQVGLSGGVNYDKNLGQPSFGNNGGGNDVSFTNNGINENAGVTAQIPILTGGRVKAATRAAQAQANAQAAQALQVEQDIVYNTAIGYLAVLRSQQLLEVANSDLAVSNERRRVARVRFDAGAAAKLDVLRAENIVADSQLRRINAANSVALTKANLNTQMGRKPETPVRLISLDTIEPPADPNAPPTASALNLPLENLSPQQLRDVAERNRPALLAAQDQITAALANVDVAKAARKPSLSASLSGILRNPVTFLGRFALSAGLSLGQTLFDSGRAKSQITEAQALLEQARRSQDVTRQQTAFQLEQQILAVDAAQRKLDSTDAAVVTAREALRAAQVGYNAGVRTNVEVSDAQTALLSAQTDAINSRFDLANARAQLASALGMMSKDWQVAYEAVLREEIRRIRGGR